MVQIYEQVVSDSEKKDTHCIFSHWLQDSNYFTYIYSRRVLINSEVTKSHPKGDDDIKFSID